MVRRTEESHILTESLGDNCAPTALGIKRARLRPLPEIGTIAAHQVCVPDGRDVFTVTEDSLRHNSDQDGVERIIESAESLRSRNY